MLALDRRLVIGGTSAAIPPGLLLCALVWGPDLTPEFCKSHGLGRALPEERRREERIDAAREEVLHRLRARQVVARDLADGWLTLPEAAARMRDLDRHGPPFHWEGFRWTYAGASDDERHCREAIHWVASSQGRDDARAEAVKRRLEAELQELLARGPVRLPDVEEPADGRSP
jgi:hypothetical protein